MLKAWVIEPAHDAVARWTTDAFRYHWPQLAARRLWVRFFRAQSLSETKELLERARCDVIFVSTSWSDPIDETTRMFESFSKRRGRPRVVYLDTSDPTSSPFFPLLPFVDLFVKKQLLRPLARYREELRGGHVVADFLARSQRHEPLDWSFGTSLPAELERRVALGWNLGSARHLVRRLAAGHLRRPVPWKDRTIDVHYRVGLAKDDWYTVHRTQLRDALEPLRGQCELIAATGKEARVPLARFEAEMANARISVSPFGWGEITDRDFHAVSNRSLMIKPDMSHLVTDPDIYQPGITYVPVRWDGSDLVDTCLTHLARPEEAERIASAARATYRNWLVGGGFLARLGRLLERVELAEPPRAEGPASGAPGTPAAGAQP